MILLRILQVLVALGLLIFVHELGHFLAAKWAGVRVDAFSFGFGPYLLSFRRGDTTYAISAIPFGGYVKMTGQADIGAVGEDEKTVPYSYLAKPPWKRGIIVTAGVTMNLIFAYFLYVLLHMTGMPGQPPVIGGVFPNSPAAMAGLEAGDRVLEVDGRQVGSFDDFRYAYLTQPAGRPMNLLIERDGARLEKQVTPEHSAELNLSDIGVQRPSRSIEFRLGFGVRTGVRVEEITDATGETPPPSVTMGLKPGDMFVSAEGHGVDGVLQFKSLLRQYHDREMTFEVLRDGETIALTAQPMAAGEGAHTDFILGFIPSEGMVVTEVVPGSQAEKAGLVPQAIISSFLVFRSDDTDSAEVAWTGPEGKGSARLYQMESGPVFEQRIPEVVRIRSGFFASFAAGGRELGGAVRQTVDSVGKLFSGSVSMKHASGPVGIISNVYQSTKSGLDIYISMMAMLSVALAIFNILPITPLDGGLLAFILYEGIRGKPASMKVQETVQMVGLVLILALVVYVTGNDVLRLVN